MIKRQRAYYYSVCLNNYSCDCLTTYITNEKSNKAMHILVNSIYYIDTGVLLKNIPLVKFIKTTSGTRVVYFL